MLVFAKIMQNLERKKKVLFIEPSQITKKFIFEFEKL